MISRVFKLPAGSYIFCRAADFRELEGFRHKLFAEEEIGFDLRLNRLARRRGQQTHIIRRPPLLSSNRRMVMYSPFRLLWFLIVSTFTAGFKPPAEGNVQLVVRWPALTLLASQLIQAV